jgi:hypothetical protein
MRSMPLRRVAASLSVAVCLSLLVSPALHAQAKRSDRARSRQAQAQPASQSLLSTAWRYIVSAVTSAPPSTGQVTVDPNPQPPEDLGAIQDPNGAELL